MVYLQQANWRCFAGQARQTPDLSCGGQTGSLGAMKTHPENAVAAGRTRRPARLKPGLKPGLNLGLNLGEMPGEMPGANPGKMLEKQPAAS